MRKISVIMPVYNERLSWIQKSIDSIINQTYTNIELIIILDNPDNEQLKNFLLQKESKINNITILLNRKNLGIVESLNKGILKSNGELIARMDGDDIALQNRFEKEVDFLDSHNLDLVTSSVEDMDEQDSIIMSRNQHDVIGQQFEEDIKYKYLGAHPTWLGEREIFENLCGYRAVAHAEDLDFLLRALEQEYSIGLLGTPTLQYRIREKSVTLSNQLEMFINSLSVRFLYKKRALSITEPSKIIEKSRNISLADKDRYTKFSKTRKEVFYLFSSSKMTAILKLPKLFVLILLSRYAKIQIFNDIKRILKRL
ncbi:glycosyltransferase [Leuconostoc gasicomitatum]|uniref:glycosyltransferase n=1 Tax=Leuconostoc gasicomitatum TaxID=115778 RepID=UPI001CC768EF|nr:glycosyltransferase [Leuconostoc gasicomitatum]MBZ5987866.1 glycosyltransferase [Leuconostoc gasicomitatum]MBZ5989306.1 glycosyltransferase [Leuconostoc gasicomitatum]